MTKAILRLGTRRSPLALVQAEEVRAALIAAHGLGADEIELVTVLASGDRVQDRPLAEIGGKALWTKELDAALLAGEIHFAVHSAKDVETLRPAGIAATLSAPTSTSRTSARGRIAAIMKAAGRRVSTSFIEWTAKSIRCS